MRILLQFPEGLKQKAVEYSDKLEKEGHEIILSASPSFGGCDVAVDEALAVKADKIIHFGHAKFVNAKLPVEVEYVEYYLDADLSVVGQAKEQLERAKGNWGWEIKTVGLVTTVQYVKHLPKIREMLEKQGFAVKIGKGRLARHEGQILGCDAHALESIKEWIDCAVYFGPGFFHPLGIDYEKILVLNPVTQTAYWITEDVRKFRKRLTGALIRSVDAKRFGILVSTKVGQFNFSGALRARDELRKRGREAHVLVANFIDYTSIKNFLRFDAFVNTACPRLVDDYEMLEKPMVNVSELGELLKLMDEIKEIKFYEEPTAGKPAV